MSGLDEVIAAETRLSDVDGQNGRLVIRGLELAEVAGLPFEAAVEDRDLGEHRATLRA